MSERTGGTVKSAFCGGCERTMRLRKDGTFQRHCIRTLGLLCPGSQKLPDQGQQPRKTLRDWPGITRYYDVLIWNVDFAQSERTLLAAEMNLANTVDDAYKELAEIPEDEDMRVVVVVPHTGRWGTDG